MNKIKNVVDKTTKTLKDNLKTILMDLAVVGVSLIYVFYKLLTLEKTDLNPLVLLAEAVVGIICGVVIKTALGEVGLTKGYNSVRYNDAQLNYGFRRDLALPYIDSVDEYYETERAKRLYNKRKRRLASERMKYDFFFDENGDYTHPVIINRHKYNKLKKKDKNYHHAENEVVLDFRQRKCLYNAIRLKIYVPDLFNGRTFGEDIDEHEEETDKNLRKKNVTKNTLFATIISCIGVYFIPIVTWNIASIIWASLQVVLWIGFGIIQLYNNYNVVVHDRVGMLELKEKELSKFLIAQVGKEQFKKEFIKTETEQKQVDSPLPAAANEPTPQVVEVEMTEEEARAKGLIN